MNFLRGVRFSRSIFNDILHHAPRDGQGRPVLTNLDMGNSIADFPLVFDGVVFKGVSNFSGADLRRLEATRSVFEGYVDWTNILVRDTLQVDGCTFLDKLWFVYADVGCGEFESCDFKREVNFSALTATHYLDMTECTFRGPVQFRTPSGERATFRQCTFSADLTFSSPTSFELLSFSDCAVEGDFGLSTENCDVIIRSTKFSGSSATMTLAGDGEVYLAATFDATARIDAGVAGLELNSCRLQKGGEILVGEGCEVSIRNSEFGSPTLLAAASPASHNVRPRVKTLSGSNVDNLTIDTLSLRECRLMDAYNVDKLRIHSVGAFNRAPRVTGPGRQVLLEEVAWRSSRPRLLSPRWRKIVPRGTEEEVPMPVQIEQVYRSLRQGRESLKDEPGAADFYFGEMEMRRHSRHFGVERLLVALYWLVAGYGLRAWRAFASFAVIVALATALFQIYGLDTPDKPFAAATSVANNPHRPGWFSVQTWTSFDTWTYSLGTATTPFAYTDVGLTREGRLIRVVLKIVGPILLALGAVALRNRVKR